jgi:hypothetical protein
VAGAEIAGVLDFVDGTPNSPLIGGRVEDEVFETPTVP